MELSGMIDELGTAGNSMDFYQKVIEYFNDRIIKLRKAKKAAGISHPEIETREVWSEVFKRLRKEYKIPVPDPATIQSFILVYEILNNPVYPMPAMIEILTKIHASGLPMGVISDAQFFTPVIMNYFLTGHLEHTEYIPYIRKELTVFSYKVYRIKPDRRLFDAAQSVLDRKFGIASSHVLYIGNDMLKDILPAYKAGFMTALFAGDQRSLRLRDHDSLVQGIRPDYVVTHLQQVRDLL